MRNIVPDEQRSDGPKSARPVGVALESSLEGVAPLARGIKPAPRVAPTQQTFQCNHGVSYPIGQTPYPYLPVI